MVIIKVNALLNKKNMETLRAYIMEQKDTGKIILPPYCEIVADVPDDTKVEVVALQNCESDCGPGCARYPRCEYNHGRHGIVRINCPLWRAKG